MATAFANRRLFSDHYLEEVEPTLPNWVVPSSEIEAAQQRLRAVTVIAGAHRPAAIRDSAAAALRLSPTDAEQINAATVCEYMPA